MEEWHQKLHNNTSPDDVVICQVLELFFCSNFLIGLHNLILKKKYYIPPGID